MEDLRLNIERIILGAILSRNSIYYTISDIVRVDDFSLNIHKTIFDFMVEKLSENTPVDVITLMHFLSSKEISLDYLNTIKDMGKYCESLVNYAKMLKDLSTVGKLSDIAFEITKKQQDGCKVDELITWLESEIFALNVGREYSNNHIVDFKTGAIQAIEELKKIMDDPQKYMIRSGFDNLDKLLLGFRPGELICIAGRPSVGKTSISIQLGLNILKYYNTKIMFVSLEMPYDQICFKILSNMSGVPLSSFIQGKLSTNTIHQCLEIINKNAIPMYIYDSFHLTISKLRTILMQRIKKDGVRLVIIDYLQLIDSNIKNSQYNKEQEISEISRSLKRMAKELNVTIIALSQMSRDIEKRNEKEPKLSDLRGSGSLEQDCDKVLFIYRPDNNNRQLLNLFVAKNRNGPIGTVSFNYDPALNIFDEIANDDML